MIRRVLFTVLASLLVAACGRDAPQPAAHDTPYAVGSQTFFIHDETRPYDRVAGVDHGVRTLITEIWYPVDHAAIEAAGERYRRATYGDYVFGDRDVHRLMMTETTFFHLTPDTVRDGVTQADIDAAIDELFGRERGSYVDAPLADDGRPFPVVVMAHGDAGSRYNMESACEYLAAHGYLVIAPEHTGNSPYSMTGHDPALAADSGDADFRKKMSGVLELLDESGVYGAREDYGQSYAPSAAGRDSLQFLKDLDAALLERLNDLRAALRELERMNTEGFAGAGPGALELDTIGLMGRSFGGATTLVGLALEERFTSGFSVVPPGWADPRPALPAEVLEPPGAESVLFAADGPFPLTSLGKPTLLLHGSEDALIIGLADGMAAASGAPPPTADNPHPLLRSAFESTDAPVVWAELADSNHATFGVSGGYWWPALKPDTQERYFEPGVRFRLADTALAHLMQRELALAFFDLTLRGDAAARDTLLQNPFSDSGLRLDARNF